MNYTVQNNQKKVGYLIFRILKWYDLLRDIMNGTITLNDAQKEKIQLKYIIDIFISSTRLKNQNKRDEKYFTLMSANYLLQGTQIFINAFKSRIFPTHSRALLSTSDDDFDRTVTSEPQSTSSPMKLTQGNRWKILPQKQFLQRLHTTCTSKSW